MAPKSLDVYSTWEIDIGDISRPPATADHHTYVVTSENTLSAINTETKTQKWALQIPEALYQPTVGSTKIYSGSTDGRLFALSLEDGTIMWETTPGAEIRTATCQGNSLYANTVDDRLICVNTADGTTEWVYDVDGSLCKNISPFVHNGVAYTGGRDCTFYVIDIENDRELWSLYMGAPVSALTKYREWITVGADNGAIQAFSKLSHETVWTQQFDASIESLIPTTDILVGTTDDRLFGISGTAGNVMWSQRFDSSIVSATATSDYVCVALSDGVVVIFDTEGSLIGKMAVPAGVTTLLLTDTQLLVGDTTGTLRSVCPTESSQLHRDKNAYHRVSVLNAAETHTPSARGHYITLPPGSDEIDLQNELDGLPTDAELVIILDGNNRTLSTGQIEEKIADQSAKWRVVDRRRPVVETELKAHSATATSKIRKYIDGTLPLPEWLSSTHYFRYLQAPADHQCPPLPTIALQRYVPMKADQNRSEKLYSFAKHSTREDGIEHKEYFIYGLMDMICRRILRAEMKHDAVIPVPGHEGGISYPLDVTTTVIDKTTPIDRQPHLIRETPTEQQKAQESRADRYENVKNSMGVDDDLAGQRVIVVDDICTSGASLHYAAKALYEAGAEDVIGMVFGSTMGKGRLISVDGPGATIADMQLLFGGGAE